jgi:hypothetical protein
MAHSIAVAEEADKAVGSACEFWDKSDAWESSGHFGETNYSDGGQILDGRRDFATRAYGFGNHSCGGQRLGFAAIAA